MLLKNLIRRVLPSASSNQKSLDNFFTVKKPKSRKAPKLKKGPYGAWGNYYYGTGSGDTTGGADGGSDA